MTALPIPVEAGPPAGSLRFGRPTGTPAAAPCARVPMVPKAEATGAAGVCVGAGDGASALEATDTGFSWRVVIEYGGSV